jgi:hypothetical protein
MQFAGLAAVHIRVKGVLTKKRPALRARSGVWRPSGAEHVDFDRLRAFLSLLNLVLHALVLL